MAEVKYNLGTLGVIPSGAVIPFAGSAVPTGYLLCDGSEVSRTDYTYLFDAIGTTYGEGDGSTTFNLPNLKDKFIEGSGTNTVGTEMSAGLPNITGSFNSAQGTYGGSNSPYPANATSAFSASGLGNLPGREQDSYTRLYNYKYSFNASNSNSVYGNSTTVQPPSIVMQYIIKY